MSGYNVIPEVLLDENVYTLPKYESSKSNDIVIEYLSYKYEFKEMVKIAKANLKKKPEDYNLEELEGFLILQKDTFDLDSPVGIGIIGLHTILKEAQDKINNEEVDISELPLLYDATKEAYNKFVSLLNNHTRGIVDCIVYYTVNGTTAYPLQESKVKDILQLGMNLKKNYPNTSKYIHYA